MGAFASKQSGDVVDEISSNNENKDVESHIFVTETYVNDSFIGVLLELIYDR